MDKSTEREYIHSFRYLCSEFPSGTLREHESPDFLVTTETQRTVGIEIGRVFKADGKYEAQSQSLESTKDGITVAARRYAECLNTPTAHVSLYFSLTRPLRTKAQQAIARRVAQIVHDKMPHQGESIDLEYRRGLQWDHPAEVDQISINRVHSTDRHDWTWPEAGAVCSDATERLKAAIDKKNKKLGLYLRHCDECWLLIVAPSFKPSGMIHPNQHTLAQIYASCFSRTYFLDFGRGCLFRLLRKSHNPIEASHKGSLVSGTYRSDRAALR